MRNRWINGLYAVANVVLVAALIYPAPAAADVQPVGRSGVPEQKTPVGELSRPVELPVEARERQRVYRSLPTEEKVVALTFDDGPGARTRELLAILAGRQVPATFFVLGNSVLNNPGLARAIAQAGHDLANHTWSHPDLTELGWERVWWEIAACTSAIEAVGAPARLYLRPPYGRFDEQVLDVCAELGYVAVMWDVDSRDWELSDADQVLQRALARLRPGSIVLFHDRPAVTLKVLPRFINAVKGMGYRFVLLSDYLE